MNKDDLKRRVVITGMGIVSPIGCEKHVYWNRLINGIEGISELDNDISEGAYSKRYGMLDWGEIENQIEMHLTDTERTQYGLCAQIALLAAKQAFKDSGMEITQKRNDRISVVMGTAHGEIPEMHKQYGEGNNKMKLHIDLASAIARSVHAGGEVSVNTNACASSNLSFFQGYHLIKDNQADYVLAGGADVFSPITYGGFIRLKVLSEDKVMPFDINRKGTILSEGAAVLMLEDYETALSRKAPIYAEIIGFGLSNDAYSMIAPSPDGKGIEKAMRDAIRNSHISPSDIDYISLHGTGTMANDWDEMNAIQNVFGNQCHTIYASSIKGSLGHTLGAASAIETLTCALVLQQGIIPMTRNTKNIMKDCLFPIITEQSIKKNVNIIMNNAFGFGGSNCILMMKKYDGK